VGDVERVVEQFWWWEQPFRSTVAFIDRRRTALVAVAAQLTTGRPQQIAPLGPMWERTSGQVTRV